MLVCANCVSGIYITANYSVDRMLVLNAWVAKCTQFGLLSQMVLLVYVMPAGLT